MAANVPQFIFSVFWYEGVKSQNEYFILYIFYTVFLTCTNPHLFKCFLNSECVFEHWYVFCPHRKCSLIMTETRRVWIHLFAEGVWASRLPVTLSGWFAHLLFECETHVNVWVGVKRIQKRVSMSQYQNALSVHLQEHLIKRTPQQAVFHSLCFHCSSLSRYLEESFFWFFRGNWGHFTDF